MGSRFAKAALSLLSAVALCLTAVPLAYAGVWDELGEMRVRTDQAWSEFVGTDEGRWLVSEADALAARIVALPDEVTMADQGEVREIRRMYDNLKAKVDHCSFNQLAENDDYIAPQTITGLLASAGCELADLRIENAEMQLQNLDSAKSSGETAKNNTAMSSGPVEETLSTGQPPVWALVAGLVWYAVTVLQSFLAYGTAYRKAKAGGDSGVSLFGWLFVYNLAAIVPGLGIFLWKKSKG